MSRVLRWGGLEARQGATSYFILWSAAGWALSGIFLGGLYQYAAFGEVSHGFDLDSMEHMFQREQ